MTAPLDNTLVVLIGFAGTGKYTVGRVLAARTGAKLVDNHLIKELAAARRSLLVPVRLLCDVDELCRRVVSPSRVERLKDISAENARRKFAAHTVLDPRHENTVTLDVTSRTPEESADLILREVERGKSVRQKQV